MNRKEVIDKLEDHRDAILAHMKGITDILRNSAPNQHTRAYSIWIPQIITALNRDTPWLPRGDYCMQDTLDSLREVSFLHNGGLYKVVGVEK